MKRLWLPLILFAFAVSAPCAIAQDEPPPPSAEYNPASWKEFSSPEWQFAVSLPGTPEEKVFSENLSGGSVKFHLFHMKSAGAYMVICGDLSPDIKVTNAQEFLKGVRDAQFGDHGKILDEKEISLPDSSPGRALSVQAAQGYVEHIRIYLVGRRLYELEFAAREAGAPAQGLTFLHDTANKFLQSFRVLPASPNSAPRAPEATPREGEVDRMLRAMKERHEEIYGAGKADTGGTAELETINGKALSLAKPNYPPLARLAHASGEVRVEVIVDEDGKVIAAQTLSGHPLLQAAALQAARNSVITAPKLNGKTVKILGVISYIFAP